ncbi:hypothetical protein [Amycolatopsis sp. NPDC059021]|uniref:hypothetical protein n=1 Tax=Amycolatopsis sp. NPDC059021 TaxID=3346704 RepID=UPI00366BA6DA
MQPRTVTAGDPRLGPVEWVTNHLEARGQLLVRGSTIEEIVTRARAVVATGAPSASAVRLHVIRLGWWRVTPCCCHRTFATSNHPSWHYCPAGPGVPDAWRGAEVRIRFTAGAGR